MDVSERTEQIPARKARFSTEVEKIGEDAVIRCYGRLCFEGEARLLAETARHYLNLGTDLVLDFAALELLDSAGIGELVLISMQARALSQNVVIACATERIRSLLRLTNVASLFEFFDSVEEALNRCSEDAA